MGSAAMQCDPCGAFYRIGNEISYMTKKAVAKVRLSTDLGGCLFIRKKAGRP